MPHNDILNFERGYDMKLHYLGTCAGTEPMPGMHHSSTVLETGGLFYWIDAGECCAYTAHNSGMDVLKTRAVFLTHPHLDHVGGLANLLHCISKFLSPMFGKKLVHGEKLTICTPDREVMGAVHTLLRQKNFAKYDERLVSDGVIYEDKNLRVTAFHNHHLKGDGENGVWHSFSYLIEAEGKRIIFSGDLQSPEELDAMDPEKADLVIMETGHHHPDAVMEYAKSRGIRRLRFTHHGRVILNGRQEVEKKAAAFAAENQMDVALCYDGMTEEV